MPSDALGLCVYCLPSTDTEPTERRPATDTLHGVPVCDHCCTDPVSVARLLEDVVSSHTGELHVEVESVPVWDPTHQPAPRDPVLDEHLNDEDSWRPPR